MNAAIRIQGDPSTGIPHGNMVLDMGNYTCLVEPDSREDTRRRLADFFSDLMDGQASVVFDDECPDCHTVGCKGACVGAPV